MEEEEGVVIQKLINIVSEISPISYYGCAMNKQFYSLARRLKLLLPLFEELSNRKDPIPEDTLIPLSSLKEALESTEELLRLGSQGSKIYSVPEWEKIMNQFQEVTGRLEQALSGISCDKLEISDEAREQVELVLAWFRRARGRFDAPDVELSEDLLSVYIKSNDEDVDPAVLRRLTEKLQLMGINDLIQESVKKMSMLLKKIEVFVLTENPDTGALESEKYPSCGNTQPSADGNTKSPGIPNDLRSLISIELLKHPVIVSSAGETYDQSSIEKLLEEGHLAFPKIQQKLYRCAKEESKRKWKLALIPDFKFRGLLAEWCERAKINILLHKLTSGNLDDQRSAAGDVCFLAECSADNRVYIAESGAIPLLVGLLSTSDSHILEHAIAALLHLSICEDNKERIVSSGAVPAIVHLLQQGSMEVRENAAAILLGLSVVNEENKVIIGELGAIPALVTLLCEGNHRGKGDAVTALHNLCMYKENMERAVQAGLVPILKRLMNDPETDRGIEDFALAILMTLAGHPEGKAAIEAPDGVPVLIEVIGRNQILARLSRAPNIQEPGTCDAITMPLAVRELLGLGP